VSRCSVVRGVLLAALLSACGQGDPSPPAPPPQAPPAPAPAPAPVATPAAADTARPAGIPREALRYRDNFIRIWRYYFAYAESPTVGFAQVHQESRWKTSAKSPFAVGIAQFTPATAAQYAMILPQQVRDACPSKWGCPIDPNWALNALSLYDYHLHRDLAWAATPDDRWRLALAGYNGGAHWLMRERKKANNSTRWVDIANACMRSAAACKENRGYPVVIMEKWRPLYRTWLGM
jgi:Transglycosylase SLT domain